jgi:hypothetical protein
MIIAQRLDCQAMKERLADTKSPMMLELIAKEYHSLCSSQTEPVTQSSRTNETFGDKGRLYNTGSDEYYLLSRRRYATEDSFGYEGRLRLVRKYEGGGYEEKLMDYTARCNAYDKLIYVVVGEAGSEEHGNVDIKNPEKFPGEAKKAAYNLYWAACHGQFRRFK